MNVKWMWLVNTGGRRREKGITNVVQEQVKATSSQLLNIN